MALCGIPVKRSVIPFPLQNPNRLSLTKPGPGSSRSRHRPISRRRKGSFRQLLTASHRTMQDASRDAVYNRVPVAERIPRAPEQEEDP